MLIFGLVLVFLLMIAIEAPGLVRKKMWRELTAFSVLLLLGFVMSLGLLLDLPIPNPTRGIEAVFKPFTQYIEKFLI